MSDELKTRTISAHGYSVGDVIVLHRAPRWRRLKIALTRPRKSVVDQVTNTTIVLREERLTWDEWFREIWRTIAR